MRLKHIPALFLVFSILCAANAAYPEFRDYRDFSPIRTRRRWLL